MPPADKRQRKKENARLAREQREAELKKRKRNRTIRNGGIAVAIFVIVLLILTLTGHKAKKKVVASPTTSSTTATTVAPTAGVTVPAKDLAAVKCNTTKPTTSKKNTSQKAPAMTIDVTKTYTAVMTTSCGDITIALDAKNDPKGVNNFVSLARSGFYDGLTFHRAAKDFVIQGGDPAGDGSGSPGYENVIAELPKDGYPLGTLAYAKTSAAPAGSAGSQFFIVTSDHPPSLEQKTAGSYQYGVFGHVTKGIAIAKKMEGFAPASGDGTPTQPLYIDKVTITES